MENTKTPYLRITALARRYKTSRQFFRIGLTAAIYLSTLLLSTACTKENPTFSLLEDSAVFRQNSDPTASKIDILWVIDNSGSMATSQDNIANNFASFISGFTSRSLDYQMAVITTEAYRALFQANQSIAGFRTGNASLNTGVAVINPSTPNIDSVFLTNITQGINGSGDERVFQSLRTALDHPLNASYNFPRDDAFFAVIIVSDEDDGSNDSPFLLGSTLHPTSSYLDYLDTRRGVTATNRNYSISAIAIFSQACLTTASAGFPGRVLGTRYEQAVVATGGTKGEICDNFATALESIAQGILELSTAFRLNRAAKPESIKVWVNDVEIPNNATNGFTYDQASQTITFHGNAIPPAGATIRVSFDPVTIL